MKTCPVVVYSLVLSVGSISIWIFALSRGNGSLARGDVSTIDKRMIVESGPLDS